MKKKNRSWTFNCGRNLLVYPLHVSDEIFVSRKILWQPGRGKVAPGTQDFKHSHLNPLHKKMFLCQCLSFQYNLLFKSFWAPWWELFVSICWWTFKLNDYVVPNTQWNWGPSGTGEGIHVLWFLPQSLHFTLNLEHMGTWNLKKTHDRIGRVL